MNSGVGLFHATVNAVEPVAAAWRDAAGPIPIRHYLDEGLLPLASSRGALHPEVLARLEHWLTLIYADGAGAILTTCSSLTPAVAALRPRFSKPLVAIDEAMIEEALKRGSRIGIVATLPGAATTTRQLVEAAGAAQGRAVAVETAIAQGAFNSLSAGDVSAHNEAVAGAAKSLEHTADIILLAQVSMMRVLPRLSLLAVPVLTSAPGAIRGLLGRIPAAQDPVP